MPNIKFGGLYIIAPENACSGAVPDGFTEVCQYGSPDYNYADPSKTPLHKQDGVAPQCAVQGIGERRAFIPDDVVQGFLDSHSIDNYGWIFNLKTIDNGYVTPRE